MAVKLGGPPGQILQERVSYRHHRLASGADCLSGRATSTLRRTISRKFLGMLTPSSNTTLWNRCARACSPLCPA
jgi:hypothetical protein